MKTLILLMCLVPLGCTFALQKQPAQQSADEEEEEQKQQQQVNCVAQKETLLVVNRTLQNFAWDCGLANTTRIVLNKIAVTNKTQSFLISGLNDRVKYLKFSESDLNELPLFANSSNLEHLDLTFNTLRELIGNRLQTLGKLQVLNLSSNHLESIQPDAFYNLKSLKCLDLSGNNLQTLERPVLKPLDSLQYLNLSQNRLQILNQNCFGSLVYLQQLDLSSNQLRALENIELPSLARLLVAGNPNLGAHNSFVTTGRRLQTVDASRIGLRKVPAALTHSIRTLRLSHNNITLIKRGDLDSYPLLQLLDFTANNLSEIEEDALGRLESLTILYLTDNKLHFIPHSLPERLQVLHLERNRISSLQTADLEGLSQLEVLLLNGNLITKIGDNSFARLLSLVTLDLSRNPLKELPEGILGGPLALRVLRLSGLSVESLEAKDLAFPLPTTEHLIHLDMSGSAGMARSMLADTAALAAARELQELNMDGCELSYVRFDLLHYLPQLRSLHLHDNPLNCTGLEWLGEWLREQDERERVFCAHPPELSGTLLIDLQSIDNNANSVGETTPGSVGSINHRRRGSHKKEITTLSTPAGHKEGVMTRQSMNILRGLDGKHVNTGEKLNGNLFALQKSTAANATAAASSSSSSGNKQLFVESQTSMMMYKNERSVHPGMYVLGVAIVVAAAGAIILLAARFRRRTRPPPLEDTIEVSSLPSVTELW